MGVWEAEILYLCRKKAGMSQKEVAEKANLAPGSICNWESCYCTPNVTSFRKALRACGFDVFIKKVEK